MSTATPAPLYNGQVMTRDRVNAFVPNVWTEDILRYRDRKFHMAACSRTFNFVGKKGDTLHVPLVGRMAVYDRIPGQPVRLQVQDPGQYRAKVTKDREASMAIDDAVSMQSQYETRQPFTTELGYGQQRDLDNFLLGLRAAIRPDRRIFVTSDGTAAGTPEPLGEASLLAAIQLIMEADVPLDQCRWIMSPNQVLDLTVEVKYTSRDFTMATNVNGIVGTLYGLPIHVTTQITNNTLDGFRNGQDGVPEPTPGVAGSYYMPDQEDESTVITPLPRGQTGQEITRPFQSALLVHPDWSVLLKQKNIKTEYSREVLLQADAIVTVQCFGGKTYRKDHVVMLHSQGSQNPNA